MKKFIFSAALMLPIFSQLAHADCLDIYMEKYWGKTVATSRAEAWEGAEMKSTVIGGVAGMAVGAVVGSVFHHADTGAGIGAFGGLASTFWTAPRIYSHDYKSQDSQRKALRLLDEASAGIKSGFIAEVSKETKTAPETVMNIVNFGSNSRDSKLGDFCSGNLYSYEMIVTYVKNHKSKFEPASAQQSVAVGSAQ